MEIEYSNTKLEFTKGDITDQKDMDAVVNAANAELRTGGGVAGAIYRAAGTGLEKETRDMGPLKPGEAVVTAAHNLPNKHIIHCLGPVYGQDKPEGKLLANCYRNALQLADEKDIKSVAFPSISTGAFNFPVEEAADTALKAVKESISDLKNPKKIRFVLFSEEDLSTYTSAAKKIFRKDE